MGQMAKILSKEQQESLPKLEEPRRVKIDVKELHELFEKEERSNSPESQKKKREVYTISKMILWGEVYEKLKNEKKMTPILDVDKIIFELNENLKATMVKNTPTSPKEHASFEEYVLKQLT